MLASQLNCQIATQTLNNSGQQLTKTPWQPTQPSSLLQAIIEGFVDGVLILNEKGEWIHGNYRAYRICRQISHGTSPSYQVPQSIWRVCESLIGSRELFPDQKIILEAELETDNSATFRIRVRWLELLECNSPYLLVTLEDRGQTTQTLAIADAKKYGLTPREAEVWLLRRAKLPYKEIANKLYITTNTVKKHMKNIYAKQQEILWARD